MNLEKESGAEAEDETRSLGACSEASDFSIESVSSTESIEHYALVTASRKASAKSEGKEQADKQTLKSKEKEIPLICSSLDLI